MMMCFNTRQRDRGRRRSSDLQVGRVLRAAAGGGERSRAPCCTWLSEGRSTSHPFQILGSVQRYPSSDMGRAICRFWSEGACSHPDITTFMVSTLHSRYYINCDPSIHLRDYEKSGASQTHEFFSSSSCFPYIQGSNALLWLLPSVAKFQNQNP